jgi:hypothetical protein
VATSAATTVATSAATSSSSSTSFELSSAHAAPQPRHTSFTLCTISLRIRIEDVLDLQRGSYVIWRYRIKMKLAIYHVLDHVTTNVAGSADPEWCALDVIAKS